MNRSEYINRYKDIVTNSTTGTGLFPSVMMAQAILESGNGNTSLASQYNNHFGVKAGYNWQGQKVNMQTREVVAGNSLMIGDYFRVYANASDSFNDRNHMLASNANYSKAGVFSAATPEQQAIALQNAGYATDPNYASILISLINQHNLKALDTVVKKKDFSAWLWLPYSWAYPQPEYFS